MYDVIPYSTDKHTACGPTCLQMLLNYYGIQVDQKTLIEECDVRVEGCGAADLMRVARKHGMTDIIAFQMDAAELIRQDRPAIIWWKFYHWMIFAGLDDKGDVVLCNPSSGRYSIDKGTFSALYSGVSLWNGAPHDLPETATGAEEGADE